VTTRVPDLCGDQYVVVGIQGRGEQFLVGAGRVVRYARTTAAETLLAAAT
jgi:hypothetical protein